jgi:hypothetical protein
MSTCPTTQHIFPFFLLLAIHSPLMNVPLLFLETGRKRSMNTTLKTAQVYETEFPISILGLPLAIYDVLIKSLWGRDFLHPSRPALWHTQPPYNGCWTGVDLP